MTKLYLKTLVLSLLFISTSFAQNETGTAHFKIHVFKKDGKPYGNCPVTAVETSTFDRKTYHTNGSGSLDLTITEGKEWIINVNEMRNYTKLTIPSGGSSNGSATVTYDPEWWENLMKNLTDRSQLQIEEIPQRLPENIRPTATHEILEVEIKSERGKPYLGLDVKMTCFALGESYTTQTDHLGIARFSLPINNEYQIDLDGEIDFATHVVKDKAYKRRITLTYEKLQFDEVINEDGSIDQIFHEKPRPISSRVLVALNVVGGDKGGANEDVYLDMAFTNKVYHAKTNSDGVAYFLLPKKREYVVNFKYQKGAGSVDLKRFFGIGQTSMTVRYEPEERLQHPERFLPSKDELKLYDINNFRKDKYPDTPEEDLVNVHVKWGNNKIGSGSQEALLELGFSVKEPKEKKAVQNPLNIAFVLDKSGSMSGENIELLKSAMYDFIKKLRPQDNVALIFFDTEAVVAYQSQKANQNYLNDIVAAMTASGGTSIYEGLKLGYEEVQKHATGNSTDRLILLTDGYGSKPIDDVIALSENYFSKGISVSTIGVGEGYNSALLTLLSKYSGGLAHQAINSEGISEALDKEFEALLYPLASNLKVEVKYNNKIIYKSLYGIPETENKDGKVRFDLDKVYSSLDRMVLMKFKLDNPDPEIGNHAVSIDITYHDEIKNEDVAIHKEAILEWDDESDIELIHDRELAETYSVALINQMLKTIADQCDNKNYVEARKKVKETLKSIKKLNHDKLSPELIPIVEQLNTYLVGLEQAILNGK